MPLLEQLDGDLWPVALLALRVATVVLLYLFLLTAFRALRADLRATSAPVREREASPSAWEAEQRAIAPAAPGAGESWGDEWDDDEAEESWSPEPVPVPAAGRREAPQTSMRLRVWLPVAAAVLVAGFGGTALLVAGQDPGAPVSGNAPSEGATDPFEPPTAAPAPGRVTVGLAATEGAQVRVTVDGVVEFDGTLPRGEQQEWEGGERIQVWTDSGQTLQLAVNGVDLGPYSPAMGHPDWNRIDFGFWPGWAQ